MLIQRLALLCALVALPAMAQDGPPLRRVGILAAAATRNATTEALRDGLADLGWIEGRNVALDVRSYDGRLDRISEVAADFVRRGAEVLVTSGLPPALALKRAVAATPIVVASVTDPVATGLVTPEGNVAAFNVLPDDSASRQLAVLRELNPQLRRLALLWNNSNPAARLNAERVRGAALAAKFEIIALEVQGPMQIEAALGTVRGRGAQAIFVVADPQFYGSREMIGKLTTATGLPAIAQETDFADAGVLMAYGANVVDMWRQSASYVDRILNGTRPGELPVGPPTRFELVINTRSARSMRLNIPESLLARADRLVGR